MNKKIKLLSIIIISCSVFLIYKNTNKKILILNIGDHISLGINSFGIKEYSPVDYYKDYLISQQKKVFLNNDYSNKDITIKSLKEKIENTSKIKKNLIESHILFLSLGYNDIVYETNIEEEMNERKNKKIIRKIKSNYDNLIKEIRKYYNNKIVIIGIHESRVDNYYIKKSIREVNKYLENKNNIIFINTNNILNSNNDYYSNPKNSYPNYLGYRKIAENIIKSLENK